MIGNWDNTGVTVELRKIVESGVNVWDFDYPVPRPVIEYNGKTAVVPFVKETFQQKILDHFWFRQIGQETVGRFLHYFRAKVREVMPYYVKLYEFDAIFHNIEDPLESYHLEETMDRHGKDKNESSSSSNATSETVERFSDTPQGTVENIDDHLTTATKNDGNGFSAGEASSEGFSEEKYTMIRRGNIGVQPLGGEVENIRHAFINIDQMVIDDLNDLFLKIY